MAKRRGHGGFALIEVLVAMGLSAVVLLGTAEMLIRAIQIRGSAENRLLLAEAASSALERLKGGDPAGEDLALGSHEAEVDAGEKGTIRLRWDVEEAGPGILKISCAAALGAAGAGSERKRAAASVLFSRNLGF